MVKRKAEGRWESGVFVIRSETRAGQTRVSGEIVTNESSRVDFRSR